jgi:hypothetical protein
LAQRKVTTDVRIPPILSSLESQNRALNTFNGLGSITIADPYRVSSFRLAWAGQCPDKIRMVVLFSGNPIETMSTDGESLYIKSNSGRHPFINKRIKNPDLERLIAVPLTTEQIIGFLSGHIPVLPHDYAIMEKSTDNNGPIVSLKKNNTTIERFLLDENNHVFQYEIFEKKDLVYRITLKQHEKSVFMFPSLIQATQGDRSFNIKVESNTPNPFLPPETFVIKNE